MSVRRLPCFLAGIVMLCGVSMTAGDGTGYIGSVACGKCHPKQCAGQSHSGHALALQRAVDHPQAKDYMASADWRRAPAFQFVFSRRPEGFFVQAFDYSTRQSLELPVEWAFGAGNHAVTFVSRVSGDVYIEHSFSYYRDSKTMDLTPGHRLMQADSLPKAMGVLHHRTEPQDPQGGVRKCFECHSTGPVQDTTAGLAPGEMGVRCEVCHGPGAAHQKAIMDGKMTLGRGAIRHPGQMSAEQVNEFCGSCHRFPGQNFAVNWNAQWNVRHQPPYLRQSRCFLESQGRLSCFTCHSPHSSLRQADAAYYARKCMECHSGKTHLPASICRSQPSADCVSCHMPAVSITSHLKFVNHWIGIYKSGENLKPVVRTGQQQPNGRPAGRS